MNNSEHKPAQSGAHATATVPEGKTNPASNEKTKTPSTVIHDQKKTSYSGHEGAKNDKPVTTDNTFKKRNSHG